MKELKSIRRVKCCGECPVALEDRGDMVVCPFDGALAPKTIPCDLDVVAARDQVYVEVTE